MAKFGMRVFPLRGLNTQSSYQYEIPLELIHAKGSVMAKIGTVKDGVFYDNVVAVVGYGADKIIVNSMVSLDDRCIAIFGYFHDVH